MTETTNLHLTKDDPGEFYSVERVNANSDKIDNFAGETTTALANKQDTIADITAIRAGAANGATAVQPADMAAALANKQDTLTIDSEPTSGSDNPVRSGGVYSALAGKQDKTAQNFEDGANLDDFTESGMFKSIDSTKTATLYNCPVSGFGFIMIVHKLSSAASTQIIYCAGASSAKIFVRQKKSTGWNPWYVFESSTAAPPVNVPAGALNLSPQTEDA